MSNKGIKTNVKSVKVRELIRILRANERFLQSISYENKNLILFIEEFTTILKPYGNLDGEKILQILKRALKSEEVIKRKKVPTLLSESDVVHLTLNKLKDLISRETLSIKDLLLIAEKRLGIPTGTLKKMRKELIRQRILSTIQNIEKLDTIKKKAAK